MLSPFSSALAKLDGSLQSVQAELASLRGNLDADGEQLRRDLAEACRYAAALSELISYQRSKTNELDHAPLDQLIHELNVLRRTQRRRLKLLNLATELRLGHVHHHRVHRTEGLNKLRLQAVKELLELVEAPLQDKDLPGPKAGKWLEWACALQAEADDATLESLHRDFPALEEFVADMDTRYWIAGQDPAADGAALAEQATTEPADPPDREPVCVETAEHDRLARDLLAMFEKVLHAGGNGEMPRLNEDLSAISSTSQAAAASAGNSHADPTGASTSDAKRAPRWIVTERDARAVGQRPRRIEKRALDRAAGLDFLKVANAWQLDDGQARRLLGISGTMLRQLREGDHVQLTPEELTKISILVAISKGLTVLYGVKRGDKWVHRPNSNPLFEGAEPLKYMLKEGVDGLVKVRQLVGVWSGYISPEGKR